jgi:dihydrofolate reductase
MRLSIVVAASENNVIGVGNRLPWRLPDDLKRFKALTMGKPILMGRKTFESIGKPLPGRRNIVITRQAGRAIDGVTVVNSLEEALAAEQSASELMLIGGADIYRQALALTHTIYMTRVHATFAGDAFFPQLNASAWRVLEREHHPADERHAHAFTFETLFAASSA